MSEGDDAAGMRLVIHQAHWRCRHDDTGDVLVTPGCPNDAGNVPMTLGLSWVHHWGCRRDAGDVLLVGYDEVGHSSSSENAVP